MELSYFKLMFFASAILNTGIALAQEKNNGIESRATVIDYGAHPNLLADAEIVLEPDSNYELNRGSDKARLISGKIIKQDSIFISDNPIVFPANSFTAPLKKGMMVLLYLKKYPDQNAYYPIGVFNHPYPGVGK